MIRIIERLIYPIFFLTVVVGLAYWYWTTTPSYALSQIVASVKNRDPETFQRYVDIDSITDRAIDELLHGPARESGIFNNLGNPLGVGIIGFFKPEIADIARSQISNYIAKGNLSNEELTQKTVVVPAISNTISAPVQPSAIQTAPTATIQPVTTPAPLQPESPSVNRYSKQFKIKEQLRQYGLSRDGFRGIDYLKTTGPVTLVGLKFFSPKLNHDFVIELKMEDAGGYWRITEISNLSALVSLYLETKDS
ncbi:MAG: DUF2939 domain-containing protein [Candidatus Obscuribacterales bacterium]|nr:DUF2939 domain-containing protein [Candidatus Obscuribacterales bacterium]